MEMVLSEMHVPGPSKVPRKMGHDPIKTIKKRYDCTHFPRYELRLQVGQYASSHGGHMDIHRRSGSPEARERVQCYAPSRTRALRGSGHCLHRLAFRLLDFFVVPL